MSYKESEVTWRNAWLSLVDSVELFYSAYKLNPISIIFYENETKFYLKKISLSLTEWCCHENSAA
jgi:hypothetical protein